MSDEILLDVIIAELKRGTQILAVLSQLKETQYGYSLLQRLEELHVSIEAGTLYPLLRRLESQGFLQSEWDTTESRPRKYYLLSPAGLNAYESLKEAWHEVVQEMDLLMKEKH